MIRGNITVDPKTWRSRGRKLEPLRAVLTIIAIIEEVKSSEEIKREKRAGSFLERTDFAQ